MTADQASPTSSRALARMRATDAAPLGEIAALSGVGSGLT